MNKEPGEFSRSGVGIGAALILFEYLLSWLFFSFADPELWADEVPHKYYFYIMFFVSGAILIALSFRRSLRIEIIRNGVKFPNWRINVIRAIGISAFGLGTYIVYHVLKARVFGDSFIGSFIENNDYVKSVAEPFSIIGLFYYPFVLTFIYQGFLLNGFAKRIGYQNATLLVAVFYGYWTQNIVGATVTTLYLNHVYSTSRNILYPLILLLIMNQIYMVGSILYPEFWFLKAQSPPYNEELKKGLLLTFVSLPVVWPVLREIFIPVTDDGHGDPFIIDRHTHQV